MSNFGTGINPLRSLVFVRNFGNNVVKNTASKVRTKAGSIENTAIDSSLSPSEIKFHTRNNSIRVQASKNHQDRLIDLYT